MKTTTAATAATARSNYIDLHVQGLGYISRVNTVVPNGRKKDAFLRATINAMHGERGVEEGIKYVQFDVIARTEQAYEVLKKIEDQCNDPDSQVMVQFKVGDIMPTSFLQTKGKNAGQTKLALQGRLLKIYNVWLKKRNADSNEKSSYALIYEMPKQSAPEADAPANDGSDSYDDIPS